MRTHRPSDRRCARAGLAAALCAVVAVGLASPRAAFADEASPVLVKYKADIEKSIDRALAFLAKSQLKDGSFQSGMRRNTAVTSLCVMAFLAKGYTPGTGPYGEVINRGVDFVIGCQKDNGMLVGHSQSHGPMYSHTIATLMLSEVSGMVDGERQKRLDEALGKALELTLAAQKIRKNRIHQGGWRYQHNSHDSDISCTGWALMSLRSARNNGAGVPKQAITEALRFVMNCRTKDGGFGYQGPSGPGLARTGTALLCLELCGRHRDHAAVGGGEWILKHLPRSFGGGHFYYGLYYCAQGMFQLGGHYWERWATSMYQMMLKFQRGDGSWPQGSSNEAQAGKCFSTAMGVLAVSVSYRQLPIYQR
jgi:prenyltransferase beta subunit